MKLPLNKPLRIVIEIVALGLIALLFVRVLDLRRLQEYLSLVTFQVICGVLLFQLAILVVHTVQWEMILREAGIARGFLKTFWARTSGFALTYLTPSVLFVGEPVRAKLYKDDAMSYERIFATVALDKYIELVTKLPCITVGFFCLVMLDRHGTALIVASAVLLSIFLGFFVFLMVKLFTSEHFIVRFFTRILRPLERINPRASARVIRMIDEFSRDLHAIIRRKKTFCLAMLAGISIAVSRFFRPITS